MAGNKHNSDGQDSVSTIQGHCTLHPQAKLICPVCSGTKGGRGRKGRRARHTEIMDRFKDLKTHDALADILQEAGLLDDLPEDGT
jgi:hypothetical protein